MKSAVAATSAAGKRTASKAVSKAAKDGKTTLEDIVALLSDNGRDVALLTHVSSCWSAQQTFLTPDADLELAETQIDVRRLRQLIAAEVITSRRGNNNNAVLSSSDDRDTGVAASTRAAVAPFVIAEEPDAVSAYYMHDYVSRTRTPSDYFIGAERMRLAELMKLLQNAQLQCEGSASNSLLPLHRSNTQCVRRRVYPFWQQPCPPPDQHFKNASNHQLHFTSATRRATLTAVSEQLEVLSSLLDAGMVDESVDVASECSNVNGIADIPPYCYSGFQSQRSTIRLDLDLAAATATTQTADHAPSDIGQHPSMGVITNAVDSFW
jgi:hypothetical protein